MDEVKQPAGAQASPPRGPPKTRWELHHAEDEMQLSWVSEAGAVEKDPQRLWDGDSGDYIKKSVQKGENRKQYSRKINFIFVIW